MKRIANEVAIETILGTMNQDKHIIIKDREHMYDEGRIVFDGLRKELYDLKYVKFCRSRIISTDIQDNAIIFTIETISDKY